MRVPVLTAALAVCRVCFPLQDVEALRHIVELLNEYLDTFSSRWDVKRACRAGLPRRVLEYLAARGLDSDWRVDERGSNSTAISALRSGHLHVLQWINDHHPGSPTWSGFCLMEEAARSGHLAVLQWLPGNRRECSTIGFVIPQSMQLAALEGHLDVVQWLYTVGCWQLCTTRAMELAARRGHLPIVKWLHERMDEAAVNGHLEVVRFLHEHRSEGWTTNTMDVACANGHLAIVKFLHENRREGCTSEAMRRAAAIGHLEVVQWLYANRSEGHPGTALRAAATYGQAAVVEWLHPIVRGKRRGDAVIRQAAQIALEAGQIEVLDLLEKKLKRPRLG